MSSSKSILYAVILIALTIATIILEIKLLPVVLILILIFIELYNLNRKLEK